MSRVLVVLMVVAALGTAAALFSSSPASLALLATPEPAPVVVGNEVLGHASPVPVADPELALGRVTLMPGAVLPMHHHPGTQIGAVVQGTLTYTLYTGEVEWHRGDQPDAEPYRIEAGETVEVAAGDALIETPGSIHQGRNEGDVPVVIYVSTLFPAGAPRAIIDSGTPTP